MFIAQINFYYQLCPQKWAIFVLNPASKNKLHGHPWFRIFSDERYFGFCITFEAQNRNTLYPVVLKLCTTISLQERRTTGHYPVFK